MKVGSLIKNERHSKGLGVVVELKGKGQYIQVIIYWLDDNKMSKWLWAYHNGLEVLCE